MVIPYPRGSVESQLIRTMHHVPWQVWMSAEYSASDSEDDQSDKDEIELISYFGSDTDSEEEEELNQEREFTLRFASQDSSSEEEESSSDESSNETTRQNDQIIEVWDSSESQHELTAWNRPQERLSGSTRVEGLNILINQSTERILNRPGLDSNGNWRQNRMASAQMQQVNAMNRRVAHSRIENQLCFHRKRQRELIGR